MVRTSAAGRQRQAPARPGEDEAGRAKPLTGPVGDPTMRSASNPRTRTTGSRITDCQGPVPLLGAFEVRFRRQRGDGSYERGRTTATSTSTTWRGRGRKGEAPNRPRR